MPPTRPIICNYANLFKSPLASSVSCDDCVEALTTIKNFYMTYGPQERFAHPYLPSDPLLTRSEKRLCISKEEDEEYQSHSVRILSLSSTPKTTLHPGEDGYVEEVRSLVDHVLHMRCLLDQCVAGGGYLFLYIGKIYSRCCAKFLTLTPAENPCMGKVVFSTEMFDEGFMCIQDYVEVKGLLVPYLQLGSEPSRLDYTKKCCVCGEYYNAKGAKAIFCSEKCRSRFRAQEKKVTQKTS